LQKAKQFSQITSTDDGRLIDRKSLEQNVSRSIRDNLELDLIVIDARDMHRVKDISQITSTDAWR
jgi:hypothetical protein